MEGESGSIAKLTHWHVEFNVVVDGRDFLVDDIKAHVACEADVPRKTRRGQLDENRTCRKEGLGGNPLTC